MKKFCTLSEQLLLPVLPFEYSSAMGYCPWGTCMQLPSLRGNVRSFWLMCWFKGLQNNFVFFSEYLSCSSSCSVTLFLSFLRIFAQSGKWPPYLHDWYFKCCMEIPGSLRGLHHFHLFSCSYIFVLSTKCTALGYPEKQNNGNKMLLFISWNYYLVWAWLCVWDFCVCVVLFLFGFGFFGGCFVFLLLWESKYSFTSKLPDYWVSLQRAICRLRWVEWEVHCIVFGG